MVISRDGYWLPAGENLTKAGSGWLTLAHLQAGGLTIDQGTAAMAPSGTDAGTSVISSLSIAGAEAPTAKLDLTDNAAIIDYAGTPEFVMSVHVALVAIALAQLLKIGLG